MLILGMAEVEHLQEVAILFVLVFSYFYFCIFGGGEFLKSEAFYLACLVLCI